MEASAVSIDVCVDDERPKVDSLLNDLKEEYSTVYNENVELLSVRHSTPEAMDKNNYRQGDSDRTAYKKHSTICGEKERLNGITAQRLNGRKGHCAFMPLCHLGSVKHQSLSPVILINNPVIINNSSVHNRLNNL